MGREWMRLCASLGIIVGSVEGLLRAAIGLGDVLGTPSFLWGLTVIAAATSLPDAFVSIRAARQGKSIVSMATVWGSNIFDLLVAIPAGVLIAGASIIDFAIAAPMMGVLTLATILLFTMMRTCLTLTRGECWLLLGAYGVFIGWISLETLGVTNILILSRLG
ncbi:MAG: sodium:calcium antiporter [Elainellaceae cyanobacterium]